MKTKIKHFVRFSVLLSFLAIISSCESALNIEPATSISNELAIVDETSLNTALRGAYRSLGSAGYYGGDYTLQGFVPSGNVEYQVFNNLQDLNFLPEDATFQSSWNAIYSTINIVNNIIAKTPKIEDVNLTDQERNGLLGEAYFIRALAYFDLAKAYGGVPLKLTPTDDIQQNKGLKRSSLEDTYKQVLEDLDKAEELLPEEVNRIRATKYSAWALKARFYLYNENWVLAEQYATKIIERPDDFQLIKPFNAWFANGVVQTAESIFEIAFSPQNTNSLRTPMSLQSRGGEYRFRPSDEVVSTLKNDKTGGARIALLDSTVQGGSTRYAGALYYRSPATDPVYVLRVAEQYLIRAEARAHLDKLDESKDDLNSVRNRADLLNTEASSKEDILDAILEERRLEFLWEGHRYFDLVRTGNLKKEIEKLKPNLTITARLNLFPIPANEVIIGGLTPNPDY